MLIYNVLPICRKTCDIYTYYEDIVIKHHLANQVTLSIDSFFSTTSFKVSNNTSISMNALWKSHRLSSDILTVSLLAQLRL